MALKDALGKKENERRRLMGNRRRNGAKTFSLLLKEKGATIGKGAPIGEDETAEQKTLSLSHLMQMGYDGTTLTDETCPARWNSA